MESPTHPGISEPTVRRVAGASDAFTARHQAELYSLVEERWRAEADSNAAILEAERRTYAPITQLLDQDADAQRASQDLMQLRQKAWEQPTRERHTAGIHPASPHDWTLSSFRPMQHGVNVLGPPYDWEVTQPTHGLSVDVAANRHDGTSSVELAGAVGGARWATAGLGMAMQATEAGVAHIGTYWPYEWDWRIDGLWLSGHTHGMCKIVVQDGISGAVLGPAGERTLWFWSHTSQTSASGVDSGTVYNPDIEPTVNLVAGQVFNVTFLATAYVDDSGGGPLSFSSASASLHMRLPFFTVRLGIP